AMTATFVCATADVDRVGDIVVVSGVDLTNFRRNPVCLDGHDPTKPIGRWENVRVIGDQLIGTLRFSRTAAGREKFKLVQEGTLSAVSIGFEPKGIPEENDWGGNTFASWELLECSLVAIGANPNALIVTN